MKHNKMLIVWLVLAMVVVAWCTKTIVQPTEELPTQQDVMMQKDLPVDAMEKDPSPAMTQDDVEPVQEVAPDAMMMKSGMYEEYSEWWVQAALADGKKVALFFHASRCPSCRSLDKDINASLDELPENTVVFKIDYDTSSELKKKYAVTSQHTIVTIDADMNMIQKDSWTTLRKLISMLQ